MARKLSDGKKLKSSKDSSVKAVAKKSPVAAVKSAKGAKSAGKTSKPAPAKEPIKLKDAKAKDAAKKKDVVKPKDAAKSKDAKTKDTAKVKDAAAKPAKEPVKRKRKGSGVVRLKAFWGVFNQMLKRVAVFEYAERKQADKKAADLSTSSKQQHFVQLVKEIIRDEE